MLHPVPELAPAATVSVVLPRSPDSEIVPPFPVIASEKTTANAPVPDKVLLVEVTVAAALFDGWSPLRLVTELYSCPCTPGWLLEF